MGHRTIGLIGLGIMGSAMAAHLIRARYRVIGYDVLPARRLRHRRAGGAAAASAREVGRDANVILCSLPSAKALLDTAASLAAEPRRRRIVIEASTLPIAVKDEARRMLARSGTTLLDCPLSGTGTQARAGDIVVYASGDRAAYRRVTPIFERISRAHYYIGPFGAGSRMKFVANLLVAIHNVAAAEAMVLGMKAGLDPAAMVKVIGDGAGSSRMFEVRAPMMARRRYVPPSMKLGVWRKDMAIIGEFARQLKCATPLFAATAPIYTAAARRAPAWDTAAVLEVVRERSKVKGQRSK